jgi:hypothetical protein
VSRRSCTSEATGEAGNLPEAARRNQRRHA